MYLLAGQETKRLRFRVIQPDDFNLWLPFFEDPASFKHWDTKREAPAIECEKWFANQFDRYATRRGGMNALIEKDTDTLIGYCGLLVQVVDEITELEIGYSLLPEFWNKGFATESAKKCRDFAFENNFSDSLISIISLTNKPSESVALKNGMKIEKVTEYNKNKVNIFRIYKSEWSRIKPVYNNV